MNNKITLVSVLVLAFFMVTNGCKNESAKTGDVAEMFAKAQELQKDEKFSEAIKMYGRIAKDHKDTREAANSQFMIGYIYANHIKDFDKAKSEFVRFLDNFADVADSGLISGAHFEMQFMGMSIEEIPILNELGDGDTMIDLNTNESPAGE